MLQQFNISAFQQDLLRWYETSKRNLPWRKDQDPYKIWVSEIMLQQTKVDTVVPYFERFMNQFPTVYDLADANEQEVLKVWEGLGYYSRARNLQNAVREVVATYNGEIPSSPDQLGALKGVGPYTKGAILSIAFNQPEPAVDGNVMRVLSRVLKIEEDIAIPRVKKLFESYVKELISKEDPSSFNQGIMELGALVCTPKSPSCMLCPVQEYCKAFAEGIEEELPIKSKSKKQKTVPYVALLICNNHNQYIIEKRSEKGLLANLWQFPMVPINEIGMDHLENWFESEYGVSITLNRKQGNLKHVFSHIIWQLEIYEARTNQQEVNDDRLKMVDQETMDTFPFPVSHQKMMKYIG
ncbi:A/G-specific adenine glycosylase [Virgibacillus byunsanensis]|uniref:Adenine DNA glycosylase n=1 Tax=Virgibacillus byunsanensis TaxID=570945 RepID=A0ABW3LPP7_9BACI